MMSDQGRPAVPKLLSEYRSWPASGSRRRALDMQSCSPWFLTLHVYERRGRSPPSSSQRRQRWRDPAVRDGYRIASPLRWVAC